MKYIRSIILKGQFSPHNYPLCNLRMKFGIFLKTNWPLWYSHCRLFRERPSPHRYLGHQTSQHRCPPTADIWNTVTLKTDKPIIKDPVESGDIMKGMQWGQTVTQFSLKVQNIQEAVSCLKMSEFSLCISESAHLSVIAICSNMAEPVLAFQFPEMDVLLQIKKKNKLNQQMNQHTSC